MEGGKERWMDGGWGEGGQLGSVSGPPPRCWAVSVYSKPSSQAFRQGLGLEGYDSPLLCSTCGPGVAATHALRYML